MKPFIKWAGGKRWLTEREDFSIPAFPGRYIEPFFGGGAVFFHVQPKDAIVSDLNPRLIETYTAIADCPKKVRDELRKYHKSHSREFYYAERLRQRKSPYARAAQFLYLNRTCWNGLYRENLRGEFNVPIGTKSTVFDAGEDFEGISKALSFAKILCQDFEDTLGAAREGDFVFIDPPYTTAHNLNGFVKYNQKIFSWQDQCRLRASAWAAKARGAIVVVTNAQHSSIEDLYQDASHITVMDRRSVISGNSSGRRSTTELLIRI